MPHVDLVKCLSSVIGHRCLRSALALEKPLVPGGAAGAWQGTGHLQPFTQGLPELKSDITVSHDPFSSNRLSWFAWAWPTASPRR